MKVSVFIATSLDGFIAKEDGDITWLNEASLKAKDEDYGYDSFMEESEYLVMGRGSFEKVLEFDKWPYEGQKVIVVSKSLTILPTKLQNTTLFSGEIKELYTQLKNDGCKKIYIDGGKLISSFINEKLVTDMCITTIPILLGKGRRLFEDITITQELKTMESLKYPSGFIKTTYNF